MHYLIGFITAVMVLFPASDSGGKSLYQRWMDAYEKYLYQQMYDNFERERNEQETGKEEVQEAVWSYAGKNAGEYSGSDRSVCGHEDGDRALSKLDGSATGRDGVTNEQAASEETTEQFGIVADGTGTTGQGSAETEPTVGMVIAPEMENQTESRTEDGRMDENDAPAEVVREVTPLYSVDGYIPDEGLQTYLYTRLCESGIGWFFPYSVCQIAQESTWNHLAENPNQKDKGLLQYRIEYVPWMDWRNPYQQIDYYVAQMANRAAAGCTVSDMISRHMTSDYGGYNQSYVDAVMQHSNTLVQIR